MNFTKINAGNTATSIGARLKAARLRKGLTLERVAKPLGITRSCVSQWERGRSAPGARYFEQLAETLGTSVAHLLTGRRDDAPADAQSLAVEAPDVVLQARKDVARALGVDLSQVRVEVDRS